MKTRLFSADPDFDLRNRLFIQCFNSVAKRVFKQRSSDGIRYTGKAISDMHLSICRAFEAVLVGSPKSSIVPEFSTVEEKLAETILHIMNYSVSNGFRVGEALIEKLRQQTKSELV